MRIVFSKITSKNQTVITREVREKLGLKPGDRLRFSMTDKRVVIERAFTLTKDDPFALFSEWSKEADEKAYGKL